ncbi:putative ubiquitin-conjugating enzyme E2 W, partial [Ooceraea biroi]
VTEPPPGVHVDRELAGQNLTKRPPDNTFYVKTCNKNPKRTKWWYRGKSNCFTQYPQYL